MELCQNWRTLKLLGCGHRAKHVISRVVKKVISILILSLTYSQFEMKVKVHLIIFDSTNLCIS